MIKIILEEDNMVIIDFVNDVEFDLLNEIGVTYEDRLISTMEKIVRYLCTKYRKGALCLIDENELLKQEKELMKIYMKIKDKETYITY